MSAYVTAFKGFHIAMIILPQTTHFTLTVDKRRPGAVFQFKWRGMIYIIRHPKYAMFLDAYPSSNLIWYVTDGWRWRTPILISNSYQYVAIKICASYKTKPSIKLLVEAKSPLMIASWQQFVPLRENIHKLMLTTNSRSKSISRGS